MIIAYINEEYSTIICMIFAPLAVLTCASIHEYLCTNFPNDFQRMAIFKEKESYMFIPKWVLVFYSNFVFIGTFCYKVANYIIKYRVPIS
jgi:hypothetical protein